MVYPKVLTPSNFIIKDNLLSSFFILHLFESFKVWSAQVLEKKTFYSHL